MIRWYFKQLKFCFHYIETRTTKSKEHQNITSGYRPKKKNISKIDGEEIKRNYAQHIPIKCLQNLKWVCAHSHIFFLLSFIFIRSFCYRTEITATATSIFPKTDFQMASFSHLRAVTGKSTIENISNDWIKLEVSNNRNKKALNLKHWKNSRSRNSTVGSMAWNLSFFCRFYFIIHSAHWFGVKISSIILKD